MNPRYLVTGASGCVGAWVVRQLVTEGVGVVAFDRDESPARLRLLLDPEELGRVRRVVGDITDLDAVEAVVDAHHITHVIHLAAMQVPFCRAAPALGARANVVGTVNLFEAVRRRRERITGPLVYASSIAVYGETNEVPTRPESTGPAATLYGVYKRANEGCAHVYWEENGIPSVGLRPHTIYGPGRDQGVTSSPTLAMLAAAANRSFHIPYGSTLQMQYAEDVARAFIGASRIEEPCGAFVHNLKGQVVEMKEVVESIAEAVPESSGRITFEEQPLPFPGMVDASSLKAIPGADHDRPLVDGIRETVNRFKELLAAGLVSAEPGVSS